MRPKTDIELDRMRKGGRILSSVLSAVARETTIGVSLIELDRLAEQLIKKYGVQAAFKGYKGYPYVSCLSLNEEVVHGIPRKYRLRQGDILGIDIGIVFDGYCVDSALTVGIGRLADGDQKLLDVTYDALCSGIRLVRPGIKLGDIQAAIQKVVEGAGFTIVKDLCGHGIGASLQEEPQIPNFGRAGTGLTLKVGQTFALEPMVSYCSPHTAIRPDGWTVVTLDEKNAAHFEHTIEVTGDGAEILTLRKGEKFES